MFSAINGFLDTVVGYLNPVAATYNQEAEGTVPQDMQLASNATHAVVVLAGLPALASGTTAAEEEEEDLSSDFEEMTARTGPSMTSVPPALLGEDVDFESLSREEVLNYIDEVFNQARYGARVALEEGFRSIEAMGSSPEESAQFISTLGSLILTSMASLDFGEEPGLSEASMASGVAAPVVRNFNQRAAMIAQQLTAPDSAQLPLRSGLGFEAPAAQERMA